jgi:hypothetical protein
MPRSGGEPKAPLMPFSPMKLRHFKHRMPARVKTHAQSEKALRDSKKGRTIPQRSLANLLAASQAAASIEFEPAPADIQLRPADLS